MADMTIDEIKKEKVNLEKKVMELMQDFEDRTGTRLGYIDVDRGRTKCICPETMEEDRGDIENIDINMRIDG